MASPLDNTHNAMAVRLVHIPKTSYEEEFEPQTVSVRKNNVASIFVDNKDRVGGGNAFSWTNQISNYTRGVKRVAISSTTFINTIPNVCQTNNTLTYRINGVTDHIATIPIGFYSFNGTNDLATALQTALNAAVPPPPNPFTVTANTLTQTYTITAGGGDTFFIYSASPFIRFGRILCGFREDETLSASKTSELCQMYYTKYLVVESDQLSKYNKNPNIGTFNQFGDIMFVMYIQDPTRIEDRIIELANPQYTNYEPRTQISTVDFVVRDQYGLSGAVNSISPQTSSIQFNILTELA